MRHFAARRHGGPTCSTLEMLDKLRGKLVFGLMVAEFKAKPDLTCVRVGSRFVLDEGVVRLEAALVSEDPDDEELSAWDDVFVKRLPILGPRAGRCRQEFINEMQGRYGL